jgi:ADP-ribose pyrophosphatase YjhB (NUDIX family)
LVGGYVDIHQDENLEATAKRKLEEKTGVKTPYLEQCETFGDATRDPRGWSITTVYFALIPYDGIHLKAGKGAEELKWLAVEEGDLKEKLAFDHEMLLRRCIERLRNKVLYTSIPTHLLPKEFTLGELQKIYEILLGKKIDHKSFRRRILSVDLLEEAAEMRYESKKPAKLYRSKAPQKIHYFMRNIEGATGEF